MFSPDLRRTRGSSRAEEDCCRRKGTAVSWTCCFENENLKREVDLLQQGEEASGSSFVSSNNIVAVLSFGREPSFFFCVE